MNRRGQLQEPVTLFAVILIVGLILFAGMSFIRPVSLGVDASLGTTYATEVSDAYDSGVNFGVIIAFGLVCIFIIVGAYFVNTNPAFFWPYLLGMVVLGIVMWNLAGVAPAVVNSTTFGDELQRAPEAGNLIRNGAYVVIGVAAVAAIALYAKIRQ